MLEEEGLAPPGPQEARVRSEWTEISIGTEIAQINEAAKEGKALGIGYSHVGIVEAVGAEVRGVEVGRRVLSSAAHASAANVPANGVNLLPVPEGLDPALATLGVLGSVAYHIVERGAPKLLEPTAVVGQGVVGTLILQLAKQCGARPLIALDADAKRLALALELGADAVVDVSKEDAAARVKELTGGKGVTCCIEAAANHRAYETAISILALRGRLVLASAVYEPVSFRIDLDLIHRELTLIGAHQPKVPVEENPYYPYTMALNRTATMDGISAGKLKVAHLISHRIKPEEAPDVYEKLRAKDRSFVGVAIDWR
ncbi:MAG: hypothetical protein AMXMBFR7_52470 [Planctomycetota bacterium]